MRGQSLPTVRPVWLQTSSLAASMDGILHLRYCHKFYFLLSCRVTDSASYLLLSYFRVLLKNLSLSDLDHGNINHQRRRCHRRQR
jgi:hypothetical protein